MSFHDSTYWLHKKDLRGSNKNPKIRSMNHQNLANLTTQYQQTYLIYCYIIMQYLQALAWLAGQKALQNQANTEKVKPKSASGVKKLAQEVKQEKPTLKSLKHQRKSNVSTIVAMGFPNGAMSAAFRVAFNDLITPEVQEGKSFLDALDEINNQLYDALKERGTDQVAFGKGYASGVASVPESLSAFLSVSADMSGINGSAAESNFYVKTRLFEYGLAELAKHGDAFEQLLKYSSQYIQQNIGSLSTKRVSYLVGRLSGRSHATKFLPFQYRHLPTIGSFYDGIVNKDLFIANIGVYALLGEELR